MNRTRIAFWFSLLVMAFPELAQSAPRSTPAGGAAVKLPAGFRDCETPYYIVHTDLPQEQFRAIELRLSRLAEEYERRTQAFSSTRNDQKLPFYLFSNKRDYEQAGALPGSSGFFDGQSLFACATDAHDSRTWHIIQHEAFHQYAMMRLDGEDLPIWLNEGLAEYFGESIFTGDGFVSGLMPEYRLEGLRQSLAARQALPLSQLIQMSHEEWNKELTSVNYDIAWALTQFLAHGDNGKYQQALVRYIREAGKGGDAKAVFEKYIGPVGKVEARFRQWLHELPQHPTIERYAEAVVATVTSFVARAAAQKQVITDIGQLEAMVNDKSLRCSESDWLPMQLLTEVLPLATKFRDWDFGGGRRGPGMVSLRLGDQWELHGRYTLKGGRVQKVWVETQDLQQAATRRR